MGRLTTYDEFGEVWVDYNQCVNGSRDVLVKLAHYEDMEEQGRLVEQKHGTWLSVTFNKVMCSECKHIWNIMNNDVETFEHCPKCGVKMLTKEEAEAKLKELEGE